LYYNTTRNTTGNITGIIIGFVLLDSMRVIDARSNHKGAHMAEDSLITVRELKVSFQTDEGVIKAVDNVSFDIKPGETLGVVGESGCGKSVTSLTIMNMLPKPAGKIDNGSIIFSTSNGDSIDITKLDPRSREMRSLRGSEISMIFQEPMSSLTPVYTIGRQIVESLLMEEEMTKEIAREKALEMLELVGIVPAEQRFREYPHQFSGGMRQRAMIAMALCRSPRLLIADEPTTALDVTIEAQILDLLKDMKDRLKMALMIITHDLGVIGEMADRVVVMYMGKIVERASCVDIFYRAAHPYTKGLLQSIPVIGRKERLHTIKGSVPGQFELPEGCLFHPRCPKAFDKCLAQEPPEFRVGEDHGAKCWLYEKVGEMR
jgi:oligopeptide/dipeptide ABC transporter ATP-binding protein